MGYGLWDAGCVFWVMGSMGYMGYGLYGIYGLWDIWDPGGVSGCGRWDLGSQGPPGEPVCVRLPPALVGGVVGQRRPQRRRGALPGTPKPRGDPNRPTAAQGLPVPEGR